MLGVRARCFERCSTRGLKATTKLCHAAVSQRRNSLPYPQRRLRLLSASMIGTDIGAHCVIESPYVGGQVHMAPNKIYAAGHATMRISVRNEHLVADMMVSASRDWVG